jgi:hypothetical protein
MVSRVTNNNAKSPPPPPRTQGQVKISYCNASASKCKAAFSRQDMACINALKRKEKAAATNGGPLRFAWQRAAFGESLYLNYVGTPRCKT